MKRATQAAPPGTLPGVSNYRLEFKSDWPDPAAPEGTVPNPADEQPRQWSGDLYQEGDETDPVGAFAAFTGAEGVTAWLDRHDDGTLTGWVQDGQDVYRYTDPDAWAMDVDGAQMDKAGELDEGADPEAEAPDDGEEPVEGDEDPAEAETDPAEGEENPAEAADPAEEPAKDAPVDDGTGHDPSGDTPKVPGDSAAPAHDADPAVTEEDPEAVHELDDTFYTRMKKKGEKKSLALAFRVVE